MIEKHEISVIMNAVGRVVREYVSEAVSRSRADVDERIKSIPAGPQGERGIDGKDGTPGRDGKDAEPVPVESVVEIVLKRMPVVRDGIDGKDGAPGADGAPGRPGADGTVDMEAVSQMVDAAMAGAAEEFIKGLEDVS